jgi:hypothetical protein
MDRSESVSDVARTDAGMCALWRRQAFLSFVEFEDWEDWATETSNIEQSIESGDLVPLNVGGDGAFQVCVRFGPAPTLTPEEELLSIGASEPYLLVSDGLIVMGGLEEVGADGIPAHRLIDLEPGRYSAVVHLIDWKAAPGATGPDGRPSPDALPDFVVLLSSERNRARAYRRSVMTFDAPLVDGA